STAPISAAGTSPASTRIPPRVRSTRAAQTQDHEGQPMNPSKALSDVTILDFSHLLQGPFCTQLLADMGANVIKVERPGVGDLFRTMTFNNKWVGPGRESPNFLAWNRNKRSLALDLKAPE